MFILTGASGFVGKNAVLSLMNSPINSAPECIKYFSASPRTVTLSPFHIEYETDSLSALNLLDKSCSGILHCAFLSRPNITRLGIDNYIDSCRKISRTVYEFAANYPSTPIIIISSGSAAYSELPLSSHPYQFLKREEEELFKSLSSTRMVCVLRLFAGVGFFDQFPSRFAVGQFPAKLAAEK